MYVVLKIHSYVSCLFHKLGFAKLASRWSGNQSRFHWHQLKRSPSIQERVDCLFVCKDNFFFALFVPPAKKKKVDAWFLFPNQALLLRPPQICDLMLKEFLVKYLSGVCGGRNSFLCWEPGQMHKSHVGIRVDTVLLRWSNALGIY